MKRKLLTLWGLCASMVFTAIILTTATYAWFEANQKVRTDRVTTSTGVSSLKLQVSRENFAPAPNGEVALMPQTAPLMPVSTADLSSFVYNSFTSQDGYAEFFQLATDESLYYHDTIYLRAVGDGLPVGSKLRLYLDSTDSPILESLEGELLTATRLGLTFDGGDPAIIALSRVNEGTGNTRPNGSAFADGQVLSYINGAITPVDDPALYLDQVEITADNPQGQQPIAELELNRVYTVDIYFYLEGCDPDCLSDRVARDRAAMTLAFYGLLSG